VGVIGLGYIGLPLALAIHEANFNVIGLEVDAATVDVLKDGHSTVENIPDAKLTKAQSLRFHWRQRTTSWPRRTPRRYVCPHNSERATDKPGIHYLGGRCPVGVVTAQTTVILESTVYPGATEEVVGARLSAGGWTIGENLHVALSPEVIDRRNTRY